MAIVIPVETDTSKAESSFDSLKRAAKETGDKIKGSFKGTADGFEDLGDAVGLPVDKIKKLSGAMSLLASPVGVIGVSVAAITVGFVAAAAAGAALVAGVVELTEASAKAIPDLTKLQKASGVELFSAEAADRVLTAGAAIDTVGASARATGVALSSQLAPYVTETAIQLTALNLALADWVNNNSSLIDGLVKVGTAITNAFFQPLQGAAMLLAGFLKQASKLVGLVNDDMAANLNKVAEGLSEWAIAGPVAGTIKTLTTVTADYRAEAEKLVIGQKALNEALETTSDLATGVDTAIAALGDLFDNTALAQQEANTAVDKILSAVQQMPGAYDHILYAVEDVTEKTKSWRAEMDGVVASATSALGAMSSADSALSALSTTGPWGAFIAGLISFIKDFDESLASFYEFHMDFSKTLTEVPTMLLQHLQDTLAEASIAALTMIPKFVESFAQNLGPLIEALLRAIPEVAQGLIDYMVSSKAWLGIGFTIAKSLITSFISMGQDIGAAVSAWWKTFASGEWIQGIADAVSAWWAEFKEKVAEFFTALVDKLKEALSPFDEESRSNRQDRRSKAGDVIKEVFTLGLAETQYGDTPGVVRAGSRGMRAHFAPNDRVAASQTDEGLLAQALDNLGIGGERQTAGRGPVTVNWADAHRSFDGFFVRHAALGGRSTAFMNRPTGRG